jgi:hypothetical protein
MIMVTVTEENDARRWLAKRGRPVERPTPPLTALIATRQPLKGRGTGRLWVYVVLAGLAAGAYPMLFGDGATESAVGYFIYFVFQLATWDATRRRERELRASVSSRRSAEPWWKVLGGWYLASLVLAFPGGVALAVTMFFTPSARTYAVSWLGLLALSALSGGYVLTGVLRSPVFDADAESLAVGRALRAEKIYFATPALAVYPLALELLLAPGDRQPADFEPWLIGYVAAVVVLQAISAVLHRRRYRTLPPGHYGTPVDWSSPLGGSTPS